MFLAYEMHDGEEMYEPVFSDRPGDPLEEARDEVDAVQEEFGDCLKEDDMGQEELQCVNLMLRACAKGPRTDSRKVALESAKLLEKVQLRLKAAAEDLQRFDGESAAASGSTGRQAHRLTKAAAVVAHAKERLEQVSHH